MVKERFANGYYDFDLLKVLEVKVIDTSRDDGFFVEHQNGKEEFIRYTHIPVRVGYHVKFIKHETEGFVAYLVHETREYAVWNGSIIHTFGVWDIRSPLRTTGFIGIGAWVVATIIDIITFPTPQVVLIIGLASLFAGILAFWIMSARFSGQRYKFNAALCERIKELLLE